MASLRRPSVFIKPSNQLQSGSRPPAPGPSGDERRKDARKSKVGDKIKKRMSMRYAGPEQVRHEPPPLPGQPSSFLLQDPYQNVLPVDQPRSNTGDEDDLPFEDTGASDFAQFASGDFQRSVFETAPQDEAIRRRGATDATLHSEWDLSDLADDGTDIAGYVRRTLAGADDEEIKRFKAALMRGKQQNAKELQRSVFKNYAEFVVISKEISTLENDMLELKELLGQWKDLPQLMGMDATLAPTMDKDGKLERRRTQRNSVLDLQQMYKSQLTNLWSTVEGSQKYLPLIPGRHLVFETHDYVELNAATYKAKQSVSMFLLNDLLLIAGRRRMKTAPVTGEGDKERERGRMVAERCWVLADLVVVDVKDSGDLTNALKIRRGKEVCVYRTSRPEGKKALLAAFRQVSQELGEKKRKESEREQERRKTMWQGDGGSSQIPSVPGLLSPGRPLSTIGSSIADTKDLRFIDEFGDELTMAIATRDWAEAVKSVEKGQNLLRTVASDATARKLLEARLEQLKPQLISQIAHDLSSPEIRKTTTSHLVSLLTRLDRADLARDTFLSARREVMLKRIRAIKCEGDISAYISELAIVCFTVIRNTSDWFMTAFKENRMASGFVTWAKEQMDTFADLFRRQVYAPTIDAEVADESLRVTASHNRKLLRDVGLDFTFLLSSALQHDPLRTAQIHPVFQVSASAGTPAAGFHIEPSPFPGYQAEEDAESYFPHAIGTVPRVPVVSTATVAAVPAAHAAPETPLTGTTAPLSFQPRSPRKQNASDFSLSGFSFGAPVASPGSARRPSARPGLEPMGRKDSAGEDDSLR